MIEEFVKSIGGRIRTKKPLSVFVDTEEHRQKILMFLRTNDLQVIDIHVVTE